MTILIGTLIIGSASLLQVTLASRITLLHGPANLVLLSLVAWNLLDEVRPDWKWGVFAGLILSLSSALPFWVLLISYGLAALVIQYLKNNMWKIPLLTLFTSVVVGSLLIDGTTLLYLWLSAKALDLSQSFNLIVLPSIVLNMILALPVSILVGEIGKLVLPDELSA